MGREPPVPPGGHAWAVTADMIAGGVAGVVADSVVHPIDTVKARMQVARGVRYTSMRHAVRQIVATAGVRRGLYAGYGAVLAGTVPTHAIMFAVYKALKRAAEPGVADSALPAVDFACGAAGEVAALAPYVPAEVVAKRMQVAAVGPARDYRSTRHALRIIYATEGVRGLYAGLAPTMLRDVPFTAIQFSLFTWGKDLHRRLTGRQTMGDGEVTLLGFVVGAVGAAATNPADVVKTRLMTQASGADRAYRGVLHCFRRIIAEEGMTGLAKGVVPRVTWIAPASAITLAVFERVSRSLNPSPPVAPAAP
jgi:solute carrier family 25 (mitochondrial S-adenosylmethionine transporter), member 26